MDLLIQVVTALLISLIAGIFAAFTHYSMGSPQGNPMDTRQSNFKTGRILSFIGRLVINAYNRIEKKRNDVLMSKYKEWEAKNDEALTRKLNKIKAEHSKGNYTKERRHHDEQKLLHEAMMQAQEYFEKLMATKKINWVSALGACKNCFTTWMSMAIWVIAIVSGLEINMVISILAIPVTVVVSALIQLDKKPE